RPAAGIFIVAHPVAELRREDDLIAAILDRLTHDHLGLSATVGVGSVDEVDPGIKSTTDDAATIVMAGVAPRPDHHRAEGVFADRHAGATQDRAFHDSWSSPAVGSPTSDGHCSRRRRTVYSYYRMPSAVTSSIRRAGQIQNSARRTPQHASGE